jgi:hypothetical protein
VPRIAPSPRLAFPFPPVPFACRVAPAPVKRSRKTFAAKVPKGEA